MAERTLYRREIAYGIGSKFEQMIEVWATDTEVPGVIVTEDVEPGMARAGVGWNVTHGPTGYAFNATGWSMTLDGALRYAAKIGEAHPDIDWTAFDTPEAVVAAHPVGCRCLLVLKREPEIMEGD